MSKITNEQWSTMTVEQQKEQWLKLTFGQQRTFFRDLEHQAKADLLINLPSFEHVEGSKAQASDYQVSFWNALELEDDQQQESFAGFTQEQQTKLLFGLNSVQPKLNTLFLFNFANLEEQARRALWNSFSQEQQAHFISVSEKDMLVTLIDNIMNEEQRTPYLSSLTDEEKLAIDNFRAFMESMVEDIVNAGGNLNAVANNGFQVAWQNMTKEQQTELLSLLTRQELMALWCGFPLEQKLELWQQLEEEKQAKLWQGLTIDQNFLLWNGLPIDLKLKVFDMLVNLSARDTYFWVDSLPQAQKKELLLAMNDEQKGYILDISDLGNQLLFISFFDSVQEKLNLFNLLDDNNKCDLIYGAKEEWLEKQGFINQEFKTSYIQSLDSEKIDFIYNVLFSNSSKKDSFYNDLSFEQKQALTKAS